MNKQIGDMTNDELMDFIIELQEENSRYERKLDRLTNNWNELKKWCKNNLGYYGSDIGVVYKYALDKMEEIEEGK